MKKSIKFTFDVGWAFISSIIVVLFGFIINIYIARYLGVYDLGLYRLSFTVYSIVFIVCALGVPQALTKYIAEVKDDQEKIDILVSSSFFNTFIFGLIIGFIIFFVSDYVAILFEQEELSKLLKILSFCFPFVSVVQSLNGLLIGLRKMKYFTFLIFSQHALMALLTIIFVIFGFGVEGAILGLVLAIFITFLIGFIITKHFYRFNFKDFFKTGRSILSYGKKLVLTNTMGSLTYYIDMILIGYFLTASDVGYYTVAISLSRLLWLIPQSIMKITYPTTAEYWSQKNFNSLQKMLDKSMKYAACIILPLGLGIGLFAVEIIVILFGGNFLLAVLPLQILLIGTVIDGSTGRAIGATLSGVGRADLSLKISFSAAISNIILNMILIPKFGILGAAIATTISLSFGMLLNIYLIYKITRVHFDMKWYAKLAVIISLEIVICYLFELNNYINIIIILITIIIIWTLFLNKDDKRFFITLFKEMKSNLSRIIRFQ